ncbi:MAG TPA: glycosyltransferase family 4 protein [Bryobacteraceae bacterium]|nr:glycosyltransferase family 4 protein [Bryobacteraceae bacterium]
MRVLLLGPYPPPHGGVQTNLVAIRDRLLGRGHECAVINLHRFRSARDAEVYHPESAAATLRLLLRLRYDIAHLHIGGDVPARLLGLALATTLVPRTRSVLSFHSGGYASSPAGRGAHPRTLRGMVFRRFDRVIAVNPEIARLFRRFGVNQERIRLIAPHPVPPRPDAPLPPPAREFFCAHSPVLVTVGLLEPEYDLPLQMEALGDLRKRFPRAGLFIGGAGSLEADLRRRIASLEWSEHVLLAGDVPHPVALGVIAQAAVFLRTTLYDGDSVALREALHLGTPVVASDNAMRPAGVRLVPPRDRAALVAAIEECLAAPRAAAGVPPASDDNVAAVLKVYEELMERC